MQTEEMRQAMSVLMAFSEKERVYHAYQARQNFLRQQRGIQRRIAELSAAAEQAQTQLACGRTEKEQAHAQLAYERTEKEQAHAQLACERTEKEQAHAQTEAALQREAAALAEVERLKRLLANGAND
jgi:peptidoglycan hydrolase CwlO-like protein